MLASSLGIQVLIVGFDMVEKGNGTSCALIPPSVGAKVEKGSLSGCKQCTGYWQSSHIVRYHS